MSNHTAVEIFLSRLFKCAGTVSTTYYNTRVVKTDENASDIELLRQIRMLSPDIRDTFQLRSSFRQFLNTALSTERLFAIGANVGGYFARLEKLVAEHSLAIQDGRDVAAEQYEMEIREAISDIADSIDDELTILHAMVATKFAAVSTIAEKRRQNLHYQDRTSKLVSLLENFHFADFADQLAGNEDLALSFRALLEDRIPSFREKLKVVLQQLQQYLFEFRKIEDRTRLVRSFALHLNRNPDWAPKNWDEAATPPEWVGLAAPMELASHPDVAQPESEDVLREIAASIPASAEMRIERRPPGQLVEESSETVVVVAQSPLKKAVRAFFTEAAESPVWISARRWWLEHPSMTTNIGEDVWLLRLVSEDEREGRAGLWSFRRLEHPHPVFDGNVLIRDVLAARRGL